MACLPQTMFFYDQLPLGLVAKGWKQAVAFAAVSYAPALVLAILSPTIPSFAAFAAYLGRIMVWVYYLPCMALVLLRPNADA